MTIDDVRALDPEVLVWAIGSTEPHGPALPYGTDYWQAEAGRRLNEYSSDQLAKLLVALSKAEFSETFPFTSQT